MSYANDNLDASGERGRGGYTRGPWKRYEGYGVDFRRPVIVDSIPDHNGKCIANCICYVATTNDSWDANAKLIAAAPELLKVLQRYFAEDWSDRHGEMEMMFQQAIKKATGES